jgi:dolichyl-phosphate beta-glucosyltransferase
MAASITNGPIFMTENNARPGQDPVDISIIIPAYNEASRLPSFLGEVAAYCRAGKTTYEVIVVDDGSTDGTARLAGSFKEKFRNLRVLALSSNRGKGYAVKHGLLEASGNVRVSIDADGSTKPDEIGNHAHWLDEGYDIVAGSRVLRGPTQIFVARWHRRFMGGIFKFLVRAFLFDEIQDTQCGFKMFRREVLGPLLSDIRLNGFGFDIELLYTAHQKGLKIIEQPVSWRHVPGSKVNLFLDPLKMIINIFQIRHWHKKMVPFLD